jgi:hypothetical protein
MPWPERLWFKPGENTHSKAATKPPEARVTTLSFSTPLATRKRVHELARQANVSASELLRAVVTRYAHIVAQELSESPPPARTRKKRNNPA